ncbi:hypothetical protein J6590_018027 [Homalodisca vitripennis]|nr:hypothetical protein J6590_018027 [Homalodisca vitripennis]
MQSSDFRVLGTLGKQETCSSYADLAVAEPSLAQLWEFPVTSSANSQYCNLWCVSYFGEPYVCLGKNPNS